MKLKRFEELNEGIIEGDEITNNKRVTSKRPKAIPTPQSPPKTYNSLDPWKDLWVAQTHWSTEIDKVFTNKTDAQTYADECNTNSRGLIFASGRDDYKVMSLADAIDMIKEEVRDSNSGWGDEDY